VKYAVSKERVSSDLEMFGIILNMHFPGKEGTVDQPFDISGVITQAEWEHILVYIYHRYVTLIKAPILLTSI
jgi:hypothetical protein